MYGKIFEDIFCSTLMDFGGDTAYVFIAMIVLSDENGVLKHTAESLARVICKDVGSVKEALTHLERQDQESNLKSHGGRRIVPLTQICEDETRGWLIVNKTHYRDKRDPSERRDYMREYMRKYRENKGVNSSKTNLTELANTDTDTDTDKNKNTVGLKPSVLKQESLEILVFLNSKTGRDYQPVAANLEMISARLREGASVADCKAVVAKKCREWAGDEKMAQYLRPATLFNRTKFAQYRGELS